MDPSEIQQLELDKKEEHLRELAAAQPDCVRIDFRQRCDRAEAARDAIAREWEKIEGLTTRLEGLFKTRTKILVGAVVVAAIALREYNIAGDAGTILLVGSGTYLVAKGAEWYLWTQEILWRTERAVIFAFEWQSAGAAHDNLWEFRSIAANRRAVDRERQDTDAWRAKSNAVDRAMQNHWLNTRYTILCNVRFTGRWTDDKWQYHSKK